MFRRNQDKTSDGKKTARKLSGDFGAAVSWPLSVYRSQRRSRDSEELVQSLTRIPKMGIASVHCSMGAAATGTGLTVQYGSGATSLRHLDLSNLAREGNGGPKPLDDVVYEELTRTLRQCPSLVTLSLAGNALKDKTLKVLVDAMASEEKDAQFAALEDLDLSRNRLRDGNLLARLLSGPGSRCLASLNLEGNQLNDEALMAFSAGLCMCGQLRRLNLARNQIGDRGVIALAQALERQRSASMPTKLAEAAPLDASYKWLLSLSVPGLQDNSSSSGLAALDLSSTLIGDKGAEALANVMIDGTASTVPALRRANFYHTKKIGCCGRAAFEKAVQASHAKVEQHVALVSRALQSGSAISCGVLPPTPLRVQGLRLETQDADFTARIALLAHAALAHSKIHQGSDSCGSAKSSSMDDTECATTIGDELEEEAECVQSSVEISIQKAMMTSSASGVPEEPESEAPVITDMADAEPANVSPDKPTPSVADAVSLPDTTSDSESSFRSTMEDRSDEDRLDEDPWSDPANWQSLGCKKDVAELAERRLVQQGRNWVTRLPEKVQVARQPPREELKSGSCSEEELDSGSCSEEAEAERETKPEEASSSRAGAVAAVATPLRSGVHAKNWPSSESQRLGTSQAMRKIGASTADDDSYTADRKHPEASTRREPEPESSAEVGPDSAPVFSGPLSAADGADDEGTPVSEGATTSPVGVATATLQKATTSPAGVATTAVPLLIAIAADKPDTADEAGGSVSPHGAHQNGESQCMSNDEAAQAKSPCSSPCKGKGKGKGKSKKGCPPPLPPTSTGTGSCSPPPAASEEDLQKEEQEEAVEPEDGAPEAPAERAGKGALPPPKGKGKGKGPPPPGKGAPPPAESGKGSIKGGPPPPSSGKGKGGPPPPGTAKGSSKGGPPAPKGKGGPPGGKGGSKGKAAPAEPSVVPFNRKLYWKPLDLGDAEGTIFSEGNPDSARGETRGSNPRIDVDALQRMFEGDSKETEKNERSQRLLQRAQGRAEGVKVLDPKRAQNIAIVLRRLPMPTEELAKVLRGLRWENEGLLTEQIEQIQDVLPTPEEAEALSKHLSPDDAAKLRDIERMVLPLSQLKRGKSRLKLINCARSAETQLEAITRPFAHFREACDAIQGSEMLREVLLIALDVGNYINHGNLQHSRAARAISIGSLLQFRDFKTGRTSSLHFFCAQLYSADASRDAAAVLESELRPVIFAARQQLQSVLLAAAAFEQDLKMIQTECNAAADYDDNEDEQAGSPDNDDAAEVVNVQDIRGSARSRLQAMRRVVAKYGEQLNADKERTIAQVRDTLRFCGVSLPASKQPLLEFEPFMGQLAEFVNIFAHHWHEVKSDLPKYSKFFPALQKEVKVADGDMAAGKARAGAGGIQRPLRRRCSY